MNEDLCILDENGDVWEVPASDCELEGNGFWYLAAEDEDFEDFYEFCDVEVELEDDAD